MLLPRFSINARRKFDLTSAFNAFFRDDSFKLCSKAWNLPLTSKELSIRARSKSFGMCWTEQPPRAIGGNRLSYEKLRAARLGTCHGS